jgi:hypothetical protein
MFAGTFRVQLLNQPNTPVPSYPDNTGVLDTSVSLVVSVENLSRDAATV